MRMHQGAVIAMTRSVAGGIGAARAWKVNRQATVEADANLSEHMAGAPGAR